MLHRLEHMSHQPILPDFFHPRKIVPPNLRKHLGPQKPVDETDSKDRPSSNGVSPIRQSLVWLAAGWGWSEGNDEEEDVRCTEESCCGDSEDARLLPVGEGSEVEIDDAEGDDGVDDGEWVGDGVDDEAVSVAGRESEDCDQADCPVYEGLISEAVLAMREARTYGVLDQEGVR